MFFYALSCLLFDILVDGVGVPAIGTLYFESFTIIFDANYVVNEVKIHS